MTKRVLSLSGDDKVSKAWKIFIERRFRHLPIVSKDNKVVGILSDRDFISKPNSHLGAVTALIPESDVLISGVMKTNIITAHPETEIRLIAKVMIERKIGSMPLIDESGKLVGILTRTDILRAVVNNAPFELWT